jgi:hypothetical protein
MPPERLTRLPHLLSISTNHGQTTHAQKNKSVASTEDSPI